MDYKQPIEKRMTKKANVAEMACEKFLKNRKIDFTKFGFDCWKVSVEQFMKVPAPIRNTPDFVCIYNKAVFLECKGFKNVLKVKEDDLANYKFWNNFMPLHFFFYDCVNKKHHLMSYKKLRDKILLAEVDVYPDNNKTYYKIII
jgi:hypothetical protein